MNGELDQILADFLVEAQENLERLERELVQLDQDPDNEELLRSVLRIMHSLKGNASFLNLAQLEQIAHQTEDVLAKLHDHSITFVPELNTILFQSIDSIKSMLAHLEKTGEEGEFDRELMLGDLKAVLNGTRDRNVLKSPVAKEISADSH